MEAEWENLKSVSDPGEPCLMTLGRLNCAQSQFPKAEKRVGAPAFRGMEQKYSFLFFLLSTVRNPAS